MGEKLARTRSASAIGVFFIFDIHSLFVRLKVARLDFLGLIPPQFEH